MRKALFWIHLFLGVSAGIVIFVMAFTGVLLAFQRQATDWADRDVRIVDPAGRERLPVSQLLQSLTTSQGRPPSTLTLRPDASSSVEASFGRERTVYINPFDGAILGEGNLPTRDFFRSVQNWHRALGGSLRGSPGRSLVGIANLLFLTILVSGFYLWWPRSWSAKRWKTALLLRPGLTGRAQKWNLHNVVGAWCVAPLLFIVVSGTVLAYPWANDLLFRAFGSAPPSQGRRPEGGASNRRSRPSAAPAADASLDRVYQQASQLSAGWRTMAFNVPAPQDKLIRVTIDTGTGGQPQTRTDWTLARDGTVAAKHAFTDDPLARRARAIARFGHTGEAGGILGQVVAAIAAAGACLLVFTGIAMALDRWRTNLRRKSARSVPVAEEVPVLSPHA